MIDAAPCAAQDAFMVPIAEVDKDRINAGRSRPVTIYGASCAINTPSRCCGHSRWARPVGNSVIAQ